MEFHGISLTCERRSFSLISSVSCAMASGDVAEAWAPYLMAASCCAVVHGVPVSTGQPW